jgi:hypothetical protein
MFNNSMVQVTQGFQSVVGTTGSSSLIRRHSKLNNFTRSALRPEEENEEEDYVKKIIN